MKKKLILLLILFGIVALPRVLHAQVAIEKSTEITTIGSKQYYMHHVKAGETLYSLARVYEVTEEEIKNLNPEINELGLQADMVIGIPVKVDDGYQGGQGYFVYTVQESERTKSLIRRFDVSPDDFHRLNPSVGSRVFVGQKVLIPTDEPQEEIQEEQPVVHQPDTIVVHTVEPVEDTLEVVEIPSGGYVLPEVRPDTCYPSSYNAGRHYHVALLVPLYLDEIERIDTSKEKAEKTKNSRAMKFLQFYEGFMMAVDSLTENAGLHLDLKVIDVHENVASAYSAVSQLENEPIDLIVGPFFSKSFAVVEEYALRQHIQVVNPMSERGSIIVDAPNVVKLKPSRQSMVDQLADLITLRYPKAKVSLITDNNPDDTAMVAALRHALDSVVSPEVFMSNAEMLELIVRESARRQMGKRQLSTLEVEGQIFSTRSLQDNPDGTIYFDNPFEVYGTSDIEAFRNGLSAARDNVLIAYGKDIVFATKILNTINKSTQKYPITLIGLPSWSKFDNLLVPNLLNMNAIYFDERFVDYNDSFTLKFVDDYRLRYGSEPADYAFEGFDVGWYFLNSLMQYGPHAQGCLPYEHMPMMHTRYYFTKHRYEDGLENRFWSIYQYDSQSIELKPIWIYPEEE